MPKMYKFTTEDALCIYFTFTNVVAFRDTFMSEAWGKYYKTRFYQYPPALSDDATVLGGRAWGKSIGLEADMLQKMITQGNCESLLTAFRKVHVRYREEKVISYN